MTLVFIVFVRCEISARTIVFMIVVWAGGQFSWLFPAKYFEFDGLATI